MTEPSADWTGQPETGKPRPYYAAFYVRPAAGPDDRVVVCCPAVESQAAAIAVLRAAVREQAPGGVLAGPLDNLRACVDAVDQRDSDWPADAERLALAVERCAVEHGCTVQFWQNVEPDGVAAWLDHVTERRSGPYSVRATGDRVEVETTVLGTIRPFAGGPRGRDVAVEHLGARTIVRVGIPLHGPALAFGPAPVESPAGVSREVRLSADQVEFLLDAAALKNPRYRFCLLVRTGTHAQVFFGLRNAANIRQAIEAYVAHLEGRDPGDLPEPEDTGAPGDEQPGDLEGNDLTVRRPPVGLCRFWRLHT